MKIFWAHLLLQLKIGLRDGAYVFSTILVPAGVYWFFAVPESKDAYLATYLICSFSAFAFFGVVFFQYSVSTAHEKTSSWAQWTRTLPYPMITPLLARFATSLCFGTSACLLIFGIGHAFTPTDMSILTFMKAMSFLTLGSFPFLVFGIYCGTIFSSKAIVPVANFIYLVLSFTGGLWKPPEILPKVLRDLTPYIPTYHYGRLVWSIPAPDQAFEWNNAIYLIGFTLVFLTLLFLKEKTGQLHTRKAP